MNSTELQCFVQVANTLSFIKAADKMSMSQPALSKQIMSLEDELGVKLFQRTTRRVQLTNAGKQFLKDAEDFLRMEINAKNRVEQYKNGGAYTLRIGYSESNILTRMDPVLYTVHKKYPDVVPDFHSGYRDVILQMVEQGDLDLAFSWKDDTVHDLSFHPLTDDEIFCVVSKNHPLAKRKHITFNDLKDETLIINSPYAAIQSLYAPENYVYAQEHQLHYYSCRTAAEVYALTLAEYGVGLLQKHLLIPHNRLNYFKLKDLPSRQFGIFYTKGNDSPVITTFLHSANFIFDLQKKKSREGKQLMEYFEMAFENEGKSNK